ncbi:endoribonuclease CG2145-like isoform X2 [Hylaeus anthracinus]|uniref:endoribonuclease CG2145-like isoform X2 n=1 Tax=Hylaeus anthracinus TaxID=313031 RepID=UPI0023B90068|nr:endoribonuclease CG2145-like isoform X2 [Hylaeus anthracinus]
MRFKSFLLLLFCVFFIIDGISARWTSFGRSRSGGSSSHRSSNSGGGWHRSPSNGGSSHTTSYGSSSGSHGSGSSHTPSSSHTSTGSRPIGFGTSTRVNSAPHSGGSSFGTATQGHSKDVNTNFLHSEGGGATRPSQAKPAKPSFGTSHPYPITPTIGSNYPSHTGGKPGFITESKQTSPALQSSVNQGSNVPYPPGHSTTGQTNPPWSNPYLGTNNRPSAPSQTVPGQTNPPWSNPYGNGSPSISNVPYPPGHSTTGQTNPPWSNPYLGTNNRPSAPSQTVPGQTNPSWSNSYPNANRPAMPGLQPSPIGFKDHVYPQNYPTSMSSQFSQPPIGGHSYPTGNYHSIGMPMGNPYSYHPPGGVHNAPGQTYYPQQQVLAQPAAQPFIPGQTVIMVPGQQDSGRGLGQMVKEALVFSTINAGVNRLINPHTHTHYVESRPESASSAPTTHITYNNQYFNTVPGQNGSTNPINVPEGNTPAGNFSTGAFTPNVGGGNNISSPGIGNTYHPSVPNSEVPSSNGTVNGGSGTITGTGAIGNVVSPTTQSDAASNQRNQTDNINIVDNTLYYKISDDELYKITEDIFAKSHNISKYIRLNLQNRVTSTNITDEAIEPLFDVEQELLYYPSIYVMRALYDNYEHDFRQKLNRTIHIRENENLLIDTFLNTNEMAIAMQWLADHGFIDPDDFEKKDVLRRIWFTIFTGSTCGFERVFASENYGTAIIGVQDWIYFENQESAKRIDYMGYVDKLKLGDASLLKLNYKMDGIDRPNATIFVGTMPELEMSLYTICFFARSNNLCPVSLGGTKFNIYTHSFTYFGTEVIDLGLPLF